MPNGYNIPNSENSPIPPAENVDLLAPIDTGGVAGQSEATPETSLQAASQEVDGVPEDGAFTQFKEAAIDAMEKHSANLESISQREQLLAQEEKEAQEKFEQRRLALIDEIENVIKPGQQQLSKLAKQMGGMLSQFPKSEPGQHNYVQQSFLKVEVRATQDKLEIGEADIQFRIEDVEKRLSNDILEKKHATSNIVSFENDKNKKQAREDAAGQDKIGWQDLQAA